MKDVEEPNKVGVLKEKFEKRETVNSRPTGNTLIRKRAEEKVNVFTQGI
jgi:hypothetical protein